jgi:hypothetical protein
VVLCLASTLWVGEQERLWWSWRIRSKLLWLFSGTDST